MGSRWPARRSRVPPGAACAENVPRGLMSALPSSLVAAAHHGVDHVADCRPRRRGGDGAAFAGHDMVLRLGYAEQVAGGLDRGGHLVGVDGAVVVRADQTEWRRTTGRLAGVATATA